MKKTNNLIQNFILLLFTLLCILFFSEIGKSLSDAIKNCLNTILPSLYAMMILSQLFIKTNLHSQISRPFRKISKTIFNMPEEFFTLFLISQIAGYPIGAILLTSTVKEKKLSAKDSSKMSSVCFNCGPAFLLGTIGKQYNNYFICILVFLSCFISNLILLFFISRTCSFNEINNTPKEKISTADLVASVSDAGKSLLKMCSMILFMSIIMGIIDGIHISDYIFKNIFSNLKISNDIFHSIFISIFDISNLVTLSMHSLNILPICTLLLSFGGICVFLQISSISNNYIKVNLIFLIRIIASTFSCIICFIGKTIFFSNYETSEIVTTFAKKSDSYIIDSYSPMASLLLFIMTIILIKSLPKKTYKLKNKT